MKRQTEWAILAVLIVFMSFTPGAGPVRALLSTAVGRAIALFIVVAVFKYVSPAIGLLLAIHVTRCSRTPSWEGVDETLAEPMELCECDGGFTYNSGTKMCEKAGAEPKKPIRCACVPGEEWDAESKTCKQKKVESAPPPPPPESMPSVAGADLATVQKVASSMPPSAVPQTTGAAAAAQMASAPTTTPPPATEKFTPRESMMTLGKQYSPW